MIVRKRPLSRRQREVCDLLSLGLSTKEIAWRLGITSRTVEDHRLEVFARMGVRNAVELTRKMLGAQNEPC